MAQVCHSTGMRHFVQRPGVRMVAMPVFVHGHRLGQLARSVRHCRSRHASEHADGGKCQDQCASCDEKRTNEHGIRDTAVSLRTSDPRIHPNFGMTIVARLRHRAYACVGMIEHIVLEQDRPMVIRRQIASLGIAAIVLVHAVPAFAEGGATGDAVQGFELAADPTLEDTSPTLLDLSPTLGADISQIEAGGSHTPSIAGEAPAAEVDISAPVPASTPGCVIDITSALVIDGTDAAASGTPAVQATVDHTPSGNGGVAEPECVSMVDALVTRADGTQLSAPADGISATEALLLTRLKERRSELDTQETGLKLQEDLLRAAEVRLEERAVLLEAGANEIAAAVDAQAVKKAEEIAELAALFENMRPKDAAAVMAGLPDETLVPLARLVSARKLAPIMAELPPSRAVELTVLLAKPSQPLAALTTKP